VEAIVGILTTAGDSEHARTLNVDDTVRHQQGITAIGDQPGQPLGNPNTSLRRSQQHHTAVGGEKPAMKWDWLM
jgi:hypothetical protein